MSVHNLNCHFQSRRSIQDNKQVSYLTHYSCLHKQWEFTN